MNDTGLKVTFIFALALFVRILCTCTAPIFPCLGGGILGSSWKVSGEGEMKSGGSCLDEEQLLNIIIGLYALV